MFSHSMFAAEKNYALSQLSLRSYTVNGPANHAARLRTFSSSEKTLAFFPLLM